MNFFVSFVKKQCEYTSAAGSALTEQDIVFFFWKEGDFSEKWFFGGDFWPFGWSKPGGLQIVLSGESRAFVFILLKIIIF